MAGVVLACPWIWLRPTSHTNRASTCSKTHKDGCSTLEKPRLNERIRSYFASNPDRHMIPELVERADDIECIVTKPPKPPSSSSDS